MGGRRKYDSGRLWLEGESVCYASQNLSSWKLPIDEIRIVGEMTNPNGPFQDDYFICFVQDGGGWLEASFYAEGRDSLLDALGTRWGTPLDLHLAGSTDFASRILWPRHLRGEPLFNFTNETPRGVWQRLRNWVLPRTQQTLSQAASVELSTAAKTASGNDEE